MISPLNMSKIWRNYGAKKECHYIFEHENSPYMNNFNASMQFIECKFYQLDTKNVV